MSPFTLRRQAARVVLLDARGHVFLIQASDPADRSKRPWWEIPGGGLDRAETSEAAALRELHEEAGIVDARIGPCVWTQHARFTFGGFRFDQHERVHVAWLDRPGTDDDYRPAALEALEALAFQGHRWWALDDLLDSDEPVLPHLLRDHLPQLVAGDLPVEPLDITFEPG